MLPVLGKKAVLEWCMKEGLIGSSYVCPKCGKSMELRERTDGYIYILFPLIQYPFDKKPACTGRHGLRGENEMFGIVFKESADNGEKIAQLCNPAESHPSLFPSPIFFTSLQTARNGLFYFRDWDYRDYEAKHSEEQVKFCFSACADCIILGIANVCVVNNSEQLQIHYRDISNK
ncbi:hypothetical protein TNCV_2586731 [Trichonephila clavipes]|nr:hypothetical protein TNCV_2586731 [Trichonephila clavipes]